LDSFLTENKVDMVFSTRGPRESMNNYLKAAKHDVLFKCHSNGYSVGVVDQFADHELAARMIVQKKFYKSGQDTNSLDLIFVNRKISDPFMTMLKQSIFQFYASRNNNSVEYGKIYDEKNFKRIMNMVHSADHGGEIVTEAYSD